MIMEGLDADAGGIREEAETGRALSVGVVALVGGYFDHRSLVDLGAIGWVGHFGIVGMDGVSLVPGDEEAGGEADEEVFFAAAKAEDNAVKDVP